ncbi:hypothetical protein [Halostagnicola sp. A56]|uniref:hypothetical protein n=1 Tax=Halostagnicola sp. A56 TaxID=1495067 RepID=UPI00373FCBA8
MTVDELAGVAHIPNAEIETPKIDWRYTQRGDRLPSDGSQYTTDDPLIEEQTPEAPDQAAVTLDGSSREPEGFDGI